MPDIAHTYGNDLTVSASGDILTADGTQLGQQRVIWRLLTSPGDYIWQLQYGAGLPGFVGNTVNTARIAAVAKSQMYREAAVARTPAPQITVTQGADPIDVTLGITYADAPTKTPVVLSLNLGG